MRLHPLIPILVLLWGLIYVLVRLLQHFEHIVNP